MRPPKECPHGILGIAKCHICKSEYNKQYRQRPEIQAHEKQYQKQYHQRLEVKARSKEYGSTWIKLLLEHYNTELAKLDSQMKKWVIPPIPLEGKRIQFQNIIDNLETIREYAKSLPISVRSETTKRMLTELLENEGKLVSWRKPLPTGT